MVDAGVAVPLVDVEDAAGDEVGVARAPPVRLRVHARVEGARAHRPDQLVLEVRVLQAVLAERAVLQASHGQRVGAGRVRHVVPGLA